VDDKVLGLSWGGDGVDLALDRDPLGVDADLGLTVRIGEGKIPVNLSGRYAHVSGDVQGHLEFSGLPPSLVADVVTSLKLLSDLKDPVTGTIEGVAHRDGNIEISSFDFDSFHGRTEGSVTAGISSKSFTGVVNLHELHPWVLAEDLSFAAPLTALHLPVDGQVEFDIAGPATTALALVNDTPLSLVDPSIIAAADVGGSARTTLQVALP
jgi:hypothetical protein